jgi:hypothetical protein
MSMLLCIWHYRLPAVAGALMQHLQVVGGAPEELGSVQHAAEQVDRTALQEDLPDALRHLLAAYADLPVCR